jgi:excisionase family DNA binding protein
MVIHVDISRLKGARNVEELLTVRQVQDLLKIDRLTVYRMLKDGRLTGVKVGHQWRFSSQEIDILLCGSRRRVPGRPNGHFASDGKTHEIRTASAQRAGAILPLHCIQLIQDVFADVADVPAITTSPDGQPLTEFSHPGPLCDLVLSSRKGRTRCYATWRALAEQDAAGFGFTTCHAGLQYAGALVEVEGEHIAMVVAGPFYTESPDPAERKERITSLAEEYGLDPAQLAEAEAGVTVLDDRRRKQLPGWLESVARTFEHVGRERAELVGRLRTIAAMTNLEENSYGGITK